MSETADPDLMQLHPCPRGANAEVKVIVVQDAGADLLRIRQSVGRANTDLLSNVSGTSSSAMSSRTLRAVRPTGSRSQRSRRSAKRP